MMIVRRRITVLKCGTLAVMMFITALGSFWLNQTATSSDIEPDWLLVWTVVAIGWMVFCGIAFVGIHRRLQAGVKFEKLLEPVPALRKARRRENPDA